MRTKSCLVILSTSYRNQQRKCLVAYFNITKEFFHKMKFEIHIVLTNTLLSVTR